MFAPRSDTGSFFVVVPSQAATTFVVVRDLVRHVSSPSSG